MDAAVCLPTGWQEALRRGRGVVVELSFPAAALAPQVLADGAFGARQDGAFFFLETQGLESAKQFSLMAGQPLFSFVARGRRGVWHGGGAMSDLNDPPEQIFENLGKAFAACGIHEEKPGLCPMLGWLSYEAGSRFERLPLPRPEPLGMPDWYLMLPGEWAWLDTEKQEWRFRKLFVDRLFYIQIQSGIGVASGGYLEASIPDIVREIGKWELRVYDLIKLADKPRSQPPIRPARSLDVSDNFEKEQFCAAVQKARNFISAGDVFQVNLSHRQSTPYFGQPWPLFRRLSQINPSPQACFADLGSYQIISASPERLLMQDGSHIETHPIAGTIARDKAAEELKLSVKDRAEHVMTVDIERNDLARVCKPGSVKVKELMGVQTLSHLHHLVSRVEGTLRDDCGIPELLRAAFPGGSITGAPKIRCMEIIAELEAERRGLYTGSLGYWDPIHRKSDFNILIRTIFLGKGKAVWQVGAGIVADSDPEKEWEETLHKAAALKLALETAPL